MPEYDFVNPAVCFFVSDAATGGNLLDPDAANTILGQPIAVTYDGKRCEVTAGADALSHTRANPPQSLALRLKGANECDGIGGYHLAFGEFDPTRDLKKQSFVIDWDDGTSTEVKFDLYVTWKTNRAKRIYEAEVHSPIRVDGVARGEGYYNAWIVRLTR